MSINIKKIKSFKAFCGLDAIEMDEFEHYNIIFGNNGCGKTSLTRAFELLISKNKHIEKYRTILECHLLRLKSIIAIFCTITRLSIVSLDLKS